MATIMMPPNYISNAKISISSSNYASSRAAALVLAVCFHKTTCTFRNNTFSRKMTWSIGSSVDGSGFDPSSTDSTSGSTRLIRAIQSFQDKLRAKIQEIRKDLPKKLLFFLVGFYCATAFATVIGQTGDWDILSAALAVAVVEGIGALMYRASLPFVSKIKNLVSMFNYWKTGLCLGLFLDSFKYEMDDIIGSSIPFSFEIEIFSIFS